MIPKEIKQKPHEYFLLALIPTLGLIFYFLNHDPMVRIWVVGSVGLFYFIWAIYHHHKRGDLQFSILIEYILIILIGIIFLFDTLR